MNIPSITTGSSTQSPDSIEQIDRSKWKRDYFHLTTDERKEMLVDEIFALYLYRMSNRVNREFYQTVLAYIVFFRESFNMYGWSKKIECEHIDIEKNPTIKFDMQNKEFVLHNNAEYAPEICNEFVTIYMEERKSIIELPM